MKARTQHTLFCECGHALEFVGFEYVQCRQTRCQHYGKRFQAPTFELEEIPPPASAEGVAADPVLAVEEGEGE